MQHKRNLLTISILRAFQMLFGIVVLGLSVTLIKDHNNHDYDHDSDHTYSAVPLILPIGAAIGALTLVAAVFSIAIAWTNFLREYIEMLVDVVIVVMNIVGGTVCLVRMMTVKWLLT